MGQSGNACKHIIALAIWAVLRGAPLSENDKKQKNEVEFCGKMKE
jgi:hypothetical protein